MTTTGDFWRAIAAKSRADKRQEPVLRLIPAEIIEIGGSVHVDNKPGYVWIQEYGLGGGVSMVFNPHVQARNGLAVWVGPDQHAPYRRVIRAVNYQTMAGHPDYDASDPYLPNHHRSHEWPDGSPGADAVNVYTRAWVPGRVYAYSALTLAVAPFRYNYDGESVQYEGIQNYDVSGDQPGVGLALFLLVYLDKPSNAVGHTVGGTTVDSYTVRPDEPTYPSMPHIPLCLVRLDGSQTTFDENDFEDLRSMWDDAGAAMLSSRIQSQLREIEILMDRHFVRG